MSRSPSSTRCNRRGLSLLEVVLAISILGGSIAVIGELIRVGTISAAKTRDLTTAQILCESMLAELSAGVIAPDAVDSVPADLTGEWLYSVQSEQIDQQGLLCVTVTVHQDPGQIARPVSFTLVRWITDPAAIPAEDAAATSTGAATAGASGGTTQGGARGS